MTIKYTTFIFKFLAKIYQLLDAIIPRTTHLCFISFPDVDDNALPVFLRLLSEGDGNTKLIWLVADTKTAKLKISKKIDQTHKHKNTYSVLKKNSVQGLFAFLRSKHVFFTHGHYKFVRPRNNDNKLINLWHGMPLKAIGAIDGKSISEIQATNLTIASSNFFKPIISKAFNITESNVIVTGLPRCDALFSPSFTAKQFKRSIPESRKLIFWLPTYQSSIVGEIRNDSNKSINVLFKDFENSITSLAHLAERYRCHVAIKLHPMDILNTATIEYNPNVSIFSLKNPLPNSIDLYDILSVTDGLITDISSVSFDFMVTKKPILITKWFYDGYSRNLCFDPQLLFDATHCCKNWDSASEFFEAIKNSNQSKNKNLNLFCQFKDGKSTERLIKYIKNL